MNAMEIIRASNGRTIEARREDRIQKRVSEMQAHMARDIARPSVLDYLPEPGPWSEESEHQKRHAKLMAKYEPEWTPRPTPPYPPDLEGRLNAELAFEYRIERDVHRYGVASIDPFVQFMNAYERWKNETFNK